MVTSPFAPNVKSFVFMSRYFLKPSFAVAYNTLPLIGALSGHQLMKIILVMFILSWLVKPKSKTQYLYYLSGS